MVAKTNGVEPIDDLQGALQHLGATRVEATLLSCLLREGPMGTNEIVETTGLRQPEVSVGMHAFRRRQWVRADTVPRTGKGRPMHKYTLTAKATEIRKYYEEAGKSAIERYKRAIQVMKDDLKSAPLIRLSA